MNILIMGPAGAGKGTMSDLIIREFDIPHISTGDMLRENVRNNTELGQKAKEFMNTGRLVPDELINAMVEQRLLEPDCQKGYLLDGFPRTLVQAKAFEEMADRIGKPVESVLALEVAFDTLVDRITGRRICPKCGAIYHVRNKPSKTEGICINAVQLCLFAYSPCGWCVCACTLSCVRLFATLWAVACQARLSLGLYRHEY